MLRCKDIAAMVGVSRQAVTAVLNNSRPNCVSPEKRAEIMRIAAENNYRPHYAAQALKTGKSNIIGIVMPAWKNPYIAELCTALQQALANENYTPFFTIDNNYNPVQGNLEQLLSLQVAGMITVASGLLPDNINTPVVSYFYDDPRFDSVCLNAEVNARQILAHLKECGHSKIGILGLYKDRKNKILRAEAEKMGLELPERWIIGHDNTQTGEVFDILLEKNRTQALPTALIVHNDALALKVMRRIHERGYKVPEDFSVIGHDNISYCANSIPALTSLGCGSPDEIAAAMVDLLMKRIKDPARPREKIEIKTQVIKRESVLNLNNKMEALK